MAEYRKGVGPNALPQGGATQVNATVPGPGAYQDMSIPVEFARGQNDLADVPEGKLSENMDVLTSPPDAGFQQAFLPKERQMGLPTYVIRHLPTIMAAARDPEASPTMRAYYNWVVRMLDLQMQNETR